MKWPARSPDLTPCDFFLWGCVKQHVYRGVIDTIDELKIRIELAFRPTDDGMRERVLAEYQRRLARCIQIHGAHVEVINAYRFHFRSQKALFRANQLLPQGNGRPHQK